MDAIRGACLLTMGVTHFGGPLSPWVWQPFGFVSAAEVFFLLSGFMAGTTCARRVRQEGARASWGLGRRLWRLYRAQAIVVLAGGGLLSLAATGRSPSGVGAFWPALADSPGPALVQGLLLLAQPPPLDILPLYLVFLACVPAVVRLTVAGRWKAVAAGSVLLWALSQVTAGRLIHWATRGIPGADPPQFDVLGYQLAFVGGVLLGVDHVVTGRPGRFRLGRRSLALTAALAATLCVLRRLPFAGAPLVAALVARPSFGPLRAANFALLVALAVHARPWLSRAIVRGPLPLLGRQSLAVFTAHAVLLIWLRPSLPDVWAAGPLAGVVATLAFVAFMVAVAAGTQGRERSRASGDQGRGGSRA